MKVIGKGFSLLMQQRRSLETLFMTLFAEWRVQLYLYVYFPMRVHLFEEYLWSDYRQFFGILSCFGISFFNY